MRFEFLSGLAALLLSMPAAADVRPECAADAAIGEVARFVGDLLQSEEDGDRLQELLGRVSGGWFYRHVDPVAAEREPGWDAIYAHPTHRIVSTGLAVPSADEFCRFVAKVTFPDGYEIGREQFRPIEARTVEYIIERRREGLMLVAPLPPPYIGFSAWPIFAGRQPYADKALDPLGALLH